MARVVPRPHTNCKALLDHLKNLPDTRREIIDSISLPGFLMNPCVAGNSAEHALNLAQFILRWKEINFVTIAMPDDIHLYEGPTSPELWSWVLPVPLLAAFRQGRWLKIRLLHPRHYPITPIIFFCANIMYYVEKFLLPWTAQHELQMVRAGFTLQHHSQDYTNIIAANNECELICARRGIIIQAMKPFDDEWGTVVTVFWKDRWMRVERSIVTRGEPPPQAELKSTYPGEDGASNTLPSFLRYLPEWLVVLCVEHRECFAQDTLKLHLVHKHSATEEEATGILSISPIDYAAKSWKYVIHPYKVIDRIPDLPVVHGYRCSGPSCRYLTLNERNLISHVAATDHHLFLRRKCCLQTLSSDPARIQYFEVLLTGDFVFDEEFYSFYLEDSVEGGEI
ncbi:hypothetical protein FQN50_002073 [Emmonsiellopsis sp. PD_5]|nr:hypothetical protein FQN50_002073 [Emmonsiellopsis sp. PD_5]